MCNRHWAMRKAKYGVSAQMDLLFSEGDKKPVCVHVCEKISPLKREARLGIRSDEKKRAVF